MDVQPAFQSPIPPFIPPPHMDEPPPDEAAPAGFQTAEDEERTLRNMRRASCAYYAANMLRGKKAPPYNGRFLLGPHHQEWDRLIYEHNRILVLAYRDLGKSWFWSFAYPIWKADHLPNGKGYLFSATKDQAIQLLGFIKEEIEENPKLHHLLPLEGTRGKQWASTGIRLRNGHRILARGFKAKTRGAHPDWCVCDDVLSEDDMYSERTREKNINHFLGAIAPMVDVAGQLAIVGTPFHAADLYARLRDAQFVDGTRKGKRVYAFRKYPGLDRKGNPLWAQRHDREAFSFKRAEIGAVRFTREILVEPVSDDMSLFPESLFRGSPTEQFQARLGMPMSWWRAIGIKSVYIGVDLALSASTGADFTVVFVIGVDQHGNRWVMDILRAKGMPFDKQLGLINTAGRRYQADLIYIESNQMQRVWGDELIRTTDLPIKKFVTTGTGKAQKGTPKGNTTSQNKNSLEGGVPIVRVGLENQKWRIPRGDANSVERTEIWINEMRSFSWVEGKLQGVGTHDDTVMACWLADQAARRGGFTFSTGYESTYSGAGELPAELTGLSKKQPKGKAAKEAAAAAASQKELSEDEQLQKILGSIETERLKHEEAKRKDEAKGKRYKGRKMGETQPTPAEVANRVVPESPPPDKTFYESGEPAVTRSDHELSRANMERDMVKAAWSHIIRR